MRDHNRRPPIFRTSRSFYCVAQEGLSVELNNESRLAARETISTHIGSSPALSAPTCNRIVRDKRNLEIGLGVFSPGSDQGVGESGCHLRRYVPGMAKRPARSTLAWSRVDLDP